MFDKKSISRRTFIAITGGALALPLTVACSDADKPTAPFSTAGTVSRPVVFPPHTTDVTIRFQHSEPRLSLPGLVAAWSFDEGYGYTFRDLSGHGYDASIAGTNWMTTDSGLTTALHQRGRRSNAVYLNGSQWLQVQQKPALELQTQWTLALWIKADKPLSTMVGQALIQKRDKNQGYTLLLGEQNTVHFSVRDQQGNDHEVSTAANTVPQNQWLHIAVICDTSTGLLSIYLNGVQAAHKQGGSFTPGTSSSDLLLGHASELKDAFQGWLDEVAIFERLLTPSEISSLYIVGLPQLYIQTRETIDKERHVWNTFKGNTPIPHPLESATVFSVRFNGSLATDQGQNPIKSLDTQKLLVPGYFGGAFAAIRQPQLLYPSPLTTDQGTFSSWFLPTLDKSDAGREQKKVLFRAEGNESWLELFTQERRWKAALGQKTTVLATIQSDEQAFVYDQLLHVGLSWGEEKESKRRTLVLYLNGVAVARTDDLPKNTTLFTKQIALGGTAATSAHGLIDEVCISNTIESWGMLYPRGHVLSESAPLDLRDDCFHTPGEALVLWRSGGTGADWRYALKENEQGDNKVGEPSLYQATQQGFQPLFHPDAYGHMSSLEAGIAFNSVNDGWAGIFIQAPTQPGTPFSGYSFAINPQDNQMRLAIHHEGTIVATKVLAYDFPLVLHRTYTLTLSSINDGVLRGYINGNSMLSLQIKDAPTFSTGYAGLFTENATAHFDTIHFSALTPATQQSRQIQQRVFTKGEIHYENLSLNAFRWKKRYGIPSWQRTSKDPQVPGCIFSAADDVPVPNKSAPWRSEDSANTDMLHVDGKVLLLMRGNPRIGTISGVAALGVQYTDAVAFDGIHFTDPNLTVDVAKLDQAELLRGHLDTAPTEMRDHYPRDQRLQVNDLGGTYIGAGKVLVMAREFRNTVRPYPWYHRLVYGIYNVQSGKWDQREGHYVSWSSMDPNAQDALFNGINGTPDVTALRDPISDSYTLFLFHEYRQSDQIPTTGITGLQFDPQGQQLNLHPDYPTRGSYTKPNGDVIYGERVLFDNGIYYVHYNTDTDQIKGDWPDRFALAATLHPYSDQWVNSADNYNAKQPYFQRGGEFDYDNAAIWSGEMFKFRGRYYLYYEGFHAIDDVNAPYQNYDALDAGSRLCFATAN